MYHVFHEELTIIGCRNNPVHCTLDSIEFKGNRPIVILFTVLTCRKNNLNAFQKLKKMCYTHLLPLTFQLGLALATCDPTESEQIMDGFW